METNFLIEVFKTSVHTLRDAQRLHGQLQQLFPDCRIVFDLDDRDRVLKVAGRNFSPIAVMQLLQGQGYACLPLE